MMKPSEVLDLAADYIEQFGWCQNSGMSRNERGGFSYCAIGAIRGSIGVINKATHDAQDYQDAEDYLRVAIKKNCIWIWNDAGGRKRHEVTFALWKAADLARAEGR